MKGITKKEYNHAKLVYRTFECKAFQYYHDVYLITDVFLLANIFTVENFRESSIAHYKLDPANSFTATSFA